MKMVGRKVLVWKRRRRVDWLRCQPVVFVCRVLGAGIQSLRVYLPV